MEPIRHGTAVGQPQGARRRISRPHVDPMGADLLALFVREPLQALQRRDQSDLERGDDQHRAHAHRKRAAIGLGAAKLRGLTVAHRRDEGREILDRHQHRLAHISVHFGPFGRLHLCKCE